MGCWDGWLVSLSIPRNCALVVSFFFPLLAFALDRYWKNRREKSGVCWLPGSANACGQIGLSRMVTTTSFCKALDQDHRR